MIQKLKNLSSKLIQQATILNVALSCMIVFNATSSALQQHERLRLRNDFVKPEDVVNYYCGRDASGFVWSGLLDIERRKFTTWKSVPSQDTFYIAKNYRIENAQILGSKRDKAIVNVHYNLSGIGDAHGSKMPVNPTLKKVSFSLLKVKGKWKIQTPTWKEIAPVVVESKFEI